MLYYTRNYEPLALKYRWLVLIKKRKRQRVYMMTMMIV